MNVFDQDTPLVDEFGPSQVVTDFFPTVFLWEKCDGLTSAGCQVPNKQLYQSYSINRTERKYDTNS